MYIYIYIYIYIERTDLMMIYIYIYLYWTYSTDDIYIYLCSTYSSFLVVNVYDQGKTLCSPCIFRKALANATPQNPRRYWSGQINADESGSVGFEQGEFCIQKWVRKLTGRVSFGGETNKHGLTSLFRNTTSLCSLHLWLKHFPSKGFFLWWPRLWTSGLYV